MNRRSFLDAVLGMGFVSTIVAVAYPVWRYLIPPASAEPATQSVVAAQASQLFTLGAGTFGHIQRPVKFRDLVDAVVSLAGAAISITFTLAVLLFVVCRGVERECDLACRRVAENRAVNQTRSSAVKL